MDTLRKTAFNVRGAWKLDEVLILFDQACRIAQHHNADLASFTLIRRHASDSIAVESWPGGALALRADFGDGKGSSRADQGQSQDHWELNEDHDWDWVMFRQNYAEFTLGKFSKSSA